MSEYTYTDEYGGVLQIEPSDGWTTAAYIYAKSGAHVPAADLPKIVAAMYEAAGQQPPIILPRLNWHGTDRTAHSFNGVRVTRDYKTITLFGRSLTATTARGAATILAEMADDADAELDPAQVEGLAALIYESGVIEDSISAAGKGEDLARVLLRAGYARTEGKT